MPSDSPNARFAHLYLVLRFDRGGPTYDESDVSVVSAFHSRAAADADAARLNVLNESRRCRYVVRSVRVKDETPDAHAEHE